MSLTETRKTWLATKFFSGSTFGSSGLLSAIKSELNDESDVTSTDISWIFSNLGNTYTPSTTSVESTATIVSIDSGTEITVLPTCPSGQVCDYTSKKIILYGVTTDSTNDDSAKSWLDLHIPVGTQITLAQVNGSYYEIYDGTDNINSDLIAYLSNLTKVTPITGMTIEATVVSITDGDTFEAIQRCNAGELCVTTPFTVRLEGVSSSELEFPAGRTARTWLSEQIPPGYYVKLVIKGSDPYGRQVAQVYDQEGTNINALEIATGKAKTYNPEAESFVAKATACTDKNIVNKVTQYSNDIALLGPAMGYDPEKEPCIVIVPNKETWFSYKVQNIGNKDFVGWLGVVLTDGKKRQYEHTGSPSLASTIPPGATKTLKDMFIVPSYLVNPITWEAVINSK